MKDIYTNDKVIKIGNFLFKYRNFLFPLTLAALFILRTPINTIFGSEETSATKDQIALFICLLGLFVRAGVIGFAYIKRGGLNKKVYADELVTTGIFGICRNPLYVGNILIYFGIFLMHGDILVVLLGNIIFLFVYISLVAAEENFLKNKFGEAFSAYANDVPRWLPKLGALKSTVSGMSFDYKKVMTKDYTTIINTLFALLAIQTYKEYAANDSIAWGYVLCVPVLVAALYFIKKYKKEQAGKAAAE